ncbi:cytosine permease [Roseiterribacter gracilis]|uniref:Cytosine permease n=1 Tax=Roseiterribacter gracilis TaxID=2812848 RepID=A0A8S8X864_9PROT|nr:cytosine permease [Rhodospirillales bacterium TMPK1]
MSAQVETIAPDDFARDRVPQSATIGLLRLLLILLAIPIALPAFVLGAQLGKGLGLAGAVLGCFAGGAVLAAIAVPAAFVGARAKLSTYMLINQAFGATGGKLVNALLALSLLGWFGVIMTMFGRSAFETLQALAGAQPIGMLGWSALGCVLMIVTSVVGFRAIDRLSLLLTPFKILLLVWTLVAAISRYGMETARAALAQPDFSLAAGISMVVGGLAAGAVLQPDICRFARSARAGTIAAFLTFAVGFPLVLLLAAIPALATGESDMITIMIGLGLGVPALLIVLLAAWTMNTYNLYASSLVLTTILPHEKRWRATLVVGVIGAALGVLGISDLLVPYLLILSIAIPPIGGVYVVSYFARRDAPIAQFHIAAFAAWFAGAGFAFAGFALTPVPAVDSTLIAAVLTFLLVRRTV